MAQPVKSVNESDVYAAITRLMVEAQIPGMSVAIIKNGVVQDSMHFGLTDNRTNKSVMPYTLFEGASLSKPVVAYLTLVLVEQAKLTLNTPLVEYLDYTRIADQENAKKLTARLVLSHQTGLPNWGGEKLDFNFTPGNDFGYSGEGYVFLQRVLEKVTGSDLDSLAQKLVFKPLGMKSSYFTWQENKQLEVAKGHNRAGLAQDRPTPQANGSSSLHTTASDYALFMQAWMNRINNSDSLFNEAAKPAILMNGDERNALRDHDQRNVGWALGWGVQISPKPEILWHWGDNGVFRAFSAMQPKTGDGFVYLTNSQNGLAIINALAKYVLADLSDTVGWLNYPDIDSPGWQQKLAGYQAQGRLDYTHAIQHFENALKYDKDNKSLQERVIWLRDLLDAEKPKLTTQQLTLIPGHYAPRVVTRKDNALFYQRGQGQIRQLKQIKPNLFSVGELLEFRLEVVFDHRGQPDKLIGHYLGEGQDQSKRTAKLTSEIVR